jgi:hypothetical protein
LFEGLIYQFVYNLERHRLFNISLRRWLITLCLTLPVTMWLSLWGASRLTAVLVTLGTAAVLVAMWWAGQRRYVHFVEQDPISTSRPQGEAGTNETADLQPTGPPLPAMSKTRVCATGFFEVSGMRRYFVETPANYTTFETREHCVMTQVLLSRFLLLSRSRREEIGWWYAFFQPAMIRSVNSGWLYFSLRPRPALRLEIAQSGDSDDVVLYLSFDSKKTRSLVLADLQYDADLG